jgi:ferric-dicitrate binding protein FerR (iron transport regulator)
MKLNKDKIEELLPGYLSGELSDNDLEMIDEWRKESPENEALYRKSLKAWESIPLLKEMEQFNSFQALKKVNSRLSQAEPVKWWLNIQRAAAILLLPLMVYTSYLINQNQSKKNVLETVMTQTITSRQGMVSQFTLADGTQVWLNSDSELQFPIRFSGDKREVKLKGEAYFEVTKNEKQPFRVNANELKVDVLGTSFNVVNYEDEQQSEVILVTGKVKLSSENGGAIKQFGTISPGIRSVFEKTTGKIYAEEVDVDKFIAWREGNLIFREDQMDEVVKRLSRWFNVEIFINDPEIRNYTYKATFRDENLVQVLNLLRLSAPIDYRITEREVLPNGEFTKQKIYLMKKKRS